MTIYNGVALVFASATLCLSRLDFSMCYSTSATNYTCTFKRDITNTNNKLYIHQHVCAGPPTIKLGELCEG